MEVRRNGSYSALPFLLRSAYCILLPLPCSVYSTGYPVLLLCRILVCIEDCYSVVFWLSLHSGKRHLSNGAEQSVECSVEQKLLSRLC